MPLNLSWTQYRSPVLTSPIIFRRLIEWFACARLSESYLPRSYAATFPKRSLPWLFTNAALGGLKPAPASRLRGAFPHLLRSYAHFYIKVRSWRTITEIICDGGNDLGIDAVYIDLDNYVHFFQFKNPESTENVMAAGDVDKMLSGLHLILERNHDKIANDELRGRVEEIYQTIPNGYRIHIVTSGREIPEESKIKLDSFINSLQGPSDDFISWALENIKYLQDTFYRKSLPAIEDNLIFHIERGIPYQVRSANHDSNVYASWYTFWLQLYENTESDNCNRI